MAKQKFFVCGFTLLLLFFVTGTLPADDFKADVIREKMRRILSMQDKISKKQTQANKMRERLTENMLTLKEETTGEQRRIETASYQETIKSPRILYNLKLIQRLQAYVTKLDDILAEYEIWKAKLDYLYQKADDDLKIFETLNHMKVERLIEEIDRTIREYASANEAYLFNAKDIILKRPTKIWDEVIGRN